jgi:predicted phosphodiesterase
MIHSFQYISDIHLEFYDEDSRDFTKILEPGIAPFLILAGDIGDPGSNIFKEFIDWCRQKWQHVYYVAGNHEYFEYCKEEAKKYITSATNFENVTWLNAMYGLKENGIGLTKPIFKIK